MLRFWKPVLVALRFETEGLSQPCLGPGSLINFSLEPRQNFSLNPAGRGAHAKTGLHGVCWRVGVVLKLFAFLFLRYLGSKGYLGSMVLAMLWPLVGDRSQPEPA